MHTHRRLTKLTALAAGALLATAAPALLVPASATAPTSQQNADGSWTTTLTASGDTWVDNSSHTTSQSSSPELRVGSTNYGFTKARSYLTFDVSSLAGKLPGTVLSAQLKVSDFATGSCKGTADRLSQVTAAWTLSGLTWSKQPTTTATGSSTSAAAYGATGCPTEGVMSFDATAIVKSWLGGAANDGVQLKGDSEVNASAFRKFRSLENGTAAKVPTLVVTYNTVPNKPTGLTFSPGSYGATSSTTPTLSAAVTDPDGGKVRGHFEVYTSDGSTLLWSGDSAWGTSGDTVSVTVPDGILSEGTYAVAAYAEDPMYRSLTAAGKYLTVDLTAPTVTITSTAFTDGAWTPTAPTTNTFTFDGPADTATFDALLDGWYPFHANASSGGTGDFSFSWTPTSGWHTVAVTATDKAGNTGPTSTFSFGIGTPPAS